MQHLAACCTECGCLWLDSVGVPTQSSTRSRAQLPRKGRGSCHPPSPPTLHAVALEGWRRTMGL
eukprot:4056664-Alexandrium_andersonii.AAC.1